MASHVNSSPLSLASDGLHSPASGDDPSNVTAGAAGSVRVAVVNLTIAEPSFSTDPEHCAGCSRDAHSKTKDKSQGWILPMDYHDDSHDDQSPEEEILSVNLDPGHGESFDRWDGCTLNITLSSDMVPVCHRLGSMGCSVLEDYPAGTYVQSIQSAGGEFPTTFIMLTPEESVPATSTGLQGFPLTRENRRRLYSGGATMGFALPPGAPADASWNWDQLVRAAGGIAEVALRQGTANGVYGKLTILEPTHITCKMDVDDEIGVPIDQEKLLTAVKDYVRGKGMHDPKELSFRLWADLSNGEKWALAMTA